MDDNVVGAKFLADYPIDDELRHKVGAGNAQRLFKERIPKL
jgi:2,3-dihydroxybenzoate decarboxylase